MFRCKASRDRRVWVVAAAVVVTAATGGCGDSPTEPRPEGAATMTRSTAIGSPVRSDGQAELGKDPGDWSSEEVGRARQQLSELVKARTGSEFGCVVGRFGHRVPLLTVVRPGAGNETQIVIDAFNGPFTGPTSRLVERGRVNTQRELDQARLALTKSRPSEQIIVQPKTRDQERDCPYLIVATSRRDGSDPAVRRWLVQIRREYPARLISIRVGQVGTPGSGSAD